MTYPEISWKYDSDIEETSLDQSSAMVALDKHQRSEKYNYLFSLPYDKVARATKWYNMMWEDGYSHNQIVRVIG